MPEKLNIPKGARFHKLVVLEEAGKAADGKILWRCMCDCGNEVTVRGSRLHRGLTKSCGCYRKEARLKHGMKKTRTYRIWVGMLQRCNNRRNKLYPAYGARGITVCEKWLTFEGFFADMGICSDGLSIDRIDVNGNYEPKNCRWTTQTEQSRNTRSQLRPRNGTRLSANGQRYVAYIEIHGKYKHVGTYDSAVEARAARKRAEAELW